MRNKTAISFRKKTYAFFFLLLIFVMIIAPGIKPIRGVFDSGATFTLVGEVRINSNDDFVYDPDIIPLVSGGNGTEGNPYIIENVKVQPVDRDGIVIENTDVYFILKNCWVYDIESQNWGNHIGISLINVTNGRVEDCRVEPDPIVVPSANEPVFKPSYCGIKLQSCTNCKLVENYVTYDYSGYFYYGILINESSHIHILNHTRIIGYVAVRYKNSNHTNISGNMIMGRYSSTHYARYGSYNIYGVSRFGVYAENSYYNTLEYNVIWYIVDEGIALYYGSKYWTIIGNDFRVEPQYTLPDYAGKNDGVFYKSAEEPNYFIRKISPENKTYQGLAAPAAGHYPASYGLESYGNGAFPSDWRRDGDGTSYVVANKTDAGGYDHKKVLFVQPEPYTRERIYRDFDQPYSSGTVEFWVWKNTTGNARVYPCLLGGSNENMVNLLFQYDTLYYTNNTSSKSTSISVPDDKWYRFSLDFSQDGGYKGLEAHHYRFRLYDSDGRRLLYESPDAQLWGSNMGYIATFKLTLYGDASNNADAYLDALGTSWETFTYEEGDNAQEGMWLDYEKQEDEMDWSEMQYRVDNGAWRTHLVEGVTGQAVPFIIPRPQADGVHDIEVRGEDDSVWRWSNKTYFSMNYKSGLHVVEHWENQSLYVSDNNFISSGVVGLNLGNDFGGNISCYTYYLNQSNTTWTNGSYSYKINGDPKNPSGWSAPIDLGYDNETFEANFTIGYGNFNNNDHVYYYFSFQQYDNDSKYIDSYFWTADGVIQYNETAARAVAFHKKVSPVPYQLTLNYSIFSQAQVEVTLDEEGGGTNTSYPMVALEYNNISMNFYNITPSQVNYSVECVNETHLNHTMFDFGNITKQSNPAILIGDEVASPFMLPINQSYTIGDNITLPLMFYDDALRTDRNLTFTGGLINLTYVRDENFPTAYRKVMVFSHVSGDTVAIVFYDYYTRVMVYLDYKDTSIINAAQRVVFAVFENNQSYNINQEVVVVQEVVDYGTILLDDTLLGILYDPPGDNSYSEIKSGTTFTWGFEAEMSTSQGFFIEVEALAGAFGATVGGGMELSFEVTTTTGMEAEMSITMEKAMTSSLNTDDPLLIGPGRGDLYYGGAVVVEWKMIMDVHYLANRTKGENSTTLDFIEVWRNGSHIEYSPGIDASFSVLGAYLDSYNLSHLHDENPFNDNIIDESETEYVDISGDPLFWTPNYVTELSQSMTSSFTRTQTVEIELDLAVYLAWDVEVDKFVTIKTNGRIGMSFGLSFGITTTSTTEANKDIMAHLEDDDGTPIGEHDQFLTQMYMDKRYGTYGFITHRGSTYTSYPHEFGTKDRRSPVASELLSADEWLHGNTTLEALAIDDETGVKMVEFYWGNIPFFIDGISTRIGYSTIPTSGNIYDCVWDTTIIPTSYGEDVYLFVVTSDNADVNYSNTKVSSPYAVRIDNAVPTRCSVIAYTPYEKIIPLYASVLDGESGIDHVEYWLGNPSGSGSRLLGSSDDPNRAYEYLWATDPGGADDGLQVVYAVAYDKAGNSLTSEPFEINVENVKFLTEQAETAIIAGATAGGAGAGAWVLSKALSGIFKKSFAKKKVKR
ncbi:MAG: hypothetical protein ACFFCS_07710 [Candidatus Hodarchaeota archaeon]